MHQRVAVSHRARHFPGADGGAGARHVVDPARLAQLVGDQFGAFNPRGHVARAARRKRHDDTSPTWMGQACAPASLTAPKSTGKPRGFRWRNRKHAEAHSSCWIWCTGMYATIMPWRWRWCGDVASGCTTPLQRAISVFSAGISPLNRPGNGTVSRRFGARSTRSTTVDRGCHPCPWYEVPPMSPGCTLWTLAEREGFEPSIQVLARMLP